MKRAWPRASLLFSLLLLGVGLALGLREPYQPKPVSEMSFPEFKRKLARLCRTWRAPCRSCKGEGGRWESWWDDDHRERTHFASCLECGGRGTVSAGSGVSLRRLRAAFGEPAGERGEPFAFPGSGTYYYRCRDGFVGLFLTKRWWATEWIIEHAPPFLVASIPAPPGGKLSHQPGTAPRPSAEGDGRAEPSAKPIFVETFESGAVTFVELNGTPKQTATVHSFEEVPPDPTKGFRVAPISTSRGSVEVYRLKHLGSGKISEFRNVPVEKPQALHSRGDLLEHPRTGKVFGFRNVPVEGQQALRFEGNALVSDLHAAPPPFWRFSWEGSGLAEPTGRTITTGRWRITTEGWKVICDQLSEAMGVRLERKR